MAISIQTTEFNVIYVFSREAISGALKIGKTTVKAQHMEDLPPDCSLLREASLSRIKQEAVTAGVSDINLLYAEVACFKDEEGNYMSFLDKDVHKVLENSHFDKRIINVLGSVADEWYEVNLDQAKEAIAAVKNGQEAINGPVKEKPQFEKIDFREEQRDAIDQTSSFYEPGRKMLWNAKMRFGKTLCALEFIRRNDRIKRTLILTHRPAVRSGWFEDYHKIAFENYQYGSKNGDKFARLDSKDEVGKDFRTLESELSEKGLRYIYFASMQDLRGSDSVSDKGIDKNLEVFQTDWDLIILDEAHEGTQTTLGQNVIKGLSEGRNPFFLYLSGTPFNILHLFEKDEIYTWDYVMEQAAKDNWDTLHPGEPNPYIGLAKLNILTYNLGDVFENSGYTKSDDDYFNFSEFFRTWTGDPNKDGVEMPSGAILKEFIHKDDVLRFLDLLCQPEPVSYYPYSTEDFCDSLGHTLWMLPGVDQASALERMINTHRLHTELGFQVVNVAGNGSKIEEADPDDTKKIEKQEKDALKKVKNAIKEHSRTITLSCGRLTTGVSVPEWTGVFMMSGGYSTSAANYMQTIFRGQTPYKNGGIKTNCYAFDFAPDRTITVVDDYVRMQPSSRNKVRRAGQEIVDVESFLKFCPVISMEGGKEINYNAETFIREVTEAYTEKVIGNGFKGRHLFKNYADFTEEDHALLAAIGEHLTNGNPSNVSSDGRIKMSDSGLTGENGKKPKRRRKKKASSEPPRTNKPKTVQQKNRESQRVLDQIFVRIPLLLFGAVEDASGLTIEELIKKIDDPSWEEFMPVGFTKAMLRQIAHLVKIDVLIASASKTIEEAKETDSLPAEQRAVAISKMLSRFHYPDKETILTPWRVVNLHMGKTIGGYVFYDESGHLLSEPQLKNIEGITSQVFFEKESRVLEINSKSGVYPLYLAYSFYRIQCDLMHKGELTDTEKEQVWERVLKENIFVLCKTEMAKKITQRVLAGYKNYETHCKVYPNLVDILRGKNARDSKRQKLLKDLNSCAYWLGHKTRRTMKFKAAVGNPPYQITVAKKQTDNGQKRVSSIFHYFQQCSESIADYTSLIYPGGRWIHRSGKGLAQFGLSQINDPHLKRLEFYPNAAELFDSASASIADGITVVLKDMSKTAPGFKYVYSVSGLSFEIDAENPGQELMTLDPRDEEVSRLIKATVAARSFTYLNASVLSQKLFSIESDFVEKNPSLVRAFKEGDSFDKKKEIKLFTNDKGGKSGRSKWYITDRKNITSGTEYLDDWKVVVSSANAGGQKRSNQIAVLDNYSAFGRSRVALKTFKTEKEALNFLAYAKSELIRFAFLLTDEALTSLAKLVPDIGDYSDNNGLIVFDDTLDKQLFDLFNIPETNQAHIKAVLAKKSKDVEEDSDEQSE